MRGYLPIGNRRMAGQQVGRSGLAGGDAARVVGLIYGDDTSAQPMFVLVRTRHFSYPSVTDDGDSTGSCTHP